MTPLLLLALTTLPSCSGSAVTGTIHDPTAALIPGATLTLDGTVAAKPSGSDGRFNIPCLAPGPHALTVTFPGFATATVIVRLPRATALDVTLTPEAVTTTVDVDADSITEAPSVNAAGPSQTLSGKQLQQLADDPDDLLRQLQQMAAAAGGNPANATIAVDGFQDSTTLPPKSSIAYIKVNPDLFSAEYREPPFGNGGRIEVYTKPGQKTFHGALFTTNGSSWMNARDPFATAKASLGKQRYGFEFGGPIRKQGSDFFAALEHRAIDNAAVIDAVTLSPTGTSSPLSATIPTPQRLWLSSARANWQLSPRNTFIAGYTGSVSSFLNLGVGGTTLAEAAYNASYYDNTLRLSNITSASARLMHEARLSLRWFGQTTLPASTAPQIQVAGAFTGGGASVGNLHYHRFRLEADDDFILTTAHHTLKAGTQFFFNNDHRYLPNNFNGNYTFGGGPAPVLDSNNQPISGETSTISGLEQYRRAVLGLPGGTATAFSLVTGNPEVDFRQVNDALFVQDDWKLPHHLQISAGLRYFLQTRPLLTDAATPRLSLQWSPGKDAKWDLHAHAGLFAGVLIPNDYAQVLAADGVQRVSSTVYNPTFGAPFSAGATPILTRRSFAPTMSAPLYSTFNVGGSYKLSRGFNLAADLGSGRTWNQFRSNNLNAPLTASPTGPRPFAPNLNLLQVQNSGQGRIDFEFVGLSNFALKRLNFFAGTVHTSQIDDFDDSTFFTQQNSRSDAGEYARRSDQPAWQAFGNFTLHLPTKVDLSGNLYAAGDQPFNITTGFDNNGDGNFNDRPQVAAPSTPGAIQTPYGLLTSGSGIAILGRNRGLLPWTVHLDANLQRAFKLTQDPKADHPQTLTANLRSANFLNHTNVTAVGSVLGSPLFNQPYAADNGRRLEAGLRYTF